MKIAAFGQYAVKLIATAGLGCLVYAGPVLAQVNGGSDPQRDCQTLRTCNFTKGGSFRGCISTYSCKVCRFEPGKCSVGATAGACFRQVCAWSGS